MGIDILPQKPKPKCENRHSMGGVYYALEIITMVTYGDYVYSDSIEKLQMALAQRQPFIFEKFSSFETNFFLLFPFFISSLALFLSYSMFPFDSNNILF